MNANKLRGLIAEAGLSQRKLAAEIGITEKTFYDKMKAQARGGGGFRQNEMEIIITVLGMDPETVMRVFFPRCGVLT